MSSLARRVRGILAAALLWAIAWFVVGMLVGILQYVGGDLIDEWPTTAARVVSTIASNAVGWAILGALTGALFSIVLALAERNGSVQTLTYRRVVIWGIAGAVVLDLLITIYFARAIPFGRITVDVESLVILSLLGGSSAAGMLWIANRSRSAVPPAT